MDSIELYESAVADARNARADTKPVISEEAEVAADAAIRLIKQGGTLSMAQLRAFWEIQKCGYFLQVGEFNTLREWIDDAVIPHAADESMIRQIRDMAFVVERIFVPVFAAEMQRVPFKNPETGEIITVDILLKSKGLVWKLKAMSNLFASAKSDTERREIMNIIVTKKRSETVAEREKRTKGSIITLPYREDRVGDTYRVTFELTEHQLRFLKSLLGKAGEVQIA